MLDGRLGRGELAAEIVRNTRGLVKKQRTWFRTQLAPRWGYSKSSGDSSPVATLVTGSVMRIS
jgi:tRNA A37 N6-isopentenylltransferase MiaA